MDNEKTIGTTADRKVAKKLEHLIGMASDEQISQWKAEHKDGILAIRCGKHIGYFRQPTLSDMNMASCQTTEDTPLSYYETIYDEIHIGGSAEIRTEMPLFLGFMTRIKEVLRGEESELINL